ncbi:NAD(P)-binding domain-containing protein [Streptomyces sp. NPDC046862]|uniref:NAD(P)-binding domain-containing protein n=1 Tax=Streptomyces sp. NPDC046862 TaxID=3154603 RepID=UPI003456FC08
MTLRQQGLGAGHDSGRRRPAFITNLARLAIAVRVDVVLSKSRDPQTLAETVAEHGQRARAATPEDAARTGDWVVVSIPPAPYLELPAAAFSGKVVLNIGASVTRRTRNPRTAAPASSSHGASSGGISSPRSAALGSGPRPA